MKDSIFKLIVNLCYLTFLSFTIFLYFIACPEMKSFSLLLSFEVLIVWAFVTSVTKKKVQ